MSEREEERFSEKDGLGCACSRNNAEIELDVDLALEEDDVYTGLDLYKWGWVIGWEEEADVFLMNVQIHNSE